MTPAEEKAKTHWQIDKHIPLALILTVLFTFAGQWTIAVRWGSTIEYRQTDFERRITVQETNKVAERMAVIEAQQRQAAEVQNQIIQKLDRIIEAQVHRRTP